MNIIKTQTNNIRDIFSIINDDCVFYDTTWLEIDDVVREFIDTNKNKTFLMYSGMDWHNQICRADAWQYFDNIHTIPIGNIYTKYYFSFWLEFTNNYSDDIPFADDIRKHFMCLNRKPAFHRVYLCEKLYEYGLEHYGFISLGTPDEYNPPSKILTQPILLEKDIVNIDGDEITYNAISNDISTIGNIDNWRQHFLNIVTETTIHTDVFISEKTLKPILGYKPFIILGDNRIYDKLHEWGIDTFDELFGTGYKQKWWEQRVDWIVNVTASLSKEHTRSLQNLYNDLLPRLKANRENLLYARTKNLQTIHDIAKEFV